MATENPGDIVVGTFDPKALPGLGAERTTEEVVADIIAKDPAAHGVTLAERKRRAAEEARRIAAETKAFFDEPERVDFGAVSPRFQQHIDEDNQKLKNEPSAFLKKMAGIDDPDGQP